MENTLKRPEDLNDGLKPKLKQSFRLTITDFTKAVNVARQYITTTRLNISPEDEAPFIIDYKETEKDKAVSLCPYFPINKFSHQFNLDFVDQGDHPEIICKGRQSLCNYYFATKLVVKELSNEDKRQSLGFHSIAINYGVWETGQSQNKYAQECHAHVHLYFTPDAWNGVKKRISDLDILLKFNARDFSGPNYLLQDCAELEKKRLRPAEYLLMLKAVSSFESSVEKLEKSYEKIITKMEESTEKIIDAMSANTLLLIKALEKIDFYRAAPKFPDRMRRI
ncbi:parep15, putative coiled-coil protein: PROVISIONAL [Gigaspora margarita]|uniref:Parep15, putative coiled-coil protein: PROVISIONAL n=1 Tax=Gigaspora margarita TaxID=4874 RepID=A0A8H3WZI3_GIGMA|nr:parep15, putative coiled-coil protein: PROVISIONAL [Gigaspora margarita]